MLAGFLAGAELQGCFLVKFPECFYEAGAAFVSGGVLLAKFMNLFLKKKINPMIGGAGISAFPMSSRVIQKMAMEEDPTNVILMQAAGANVSGQIASVIAGGMVINLAASCNQANTVMAALTIMGKGMAGIFAAILIILLLVWILRKVSR